jgi:hypothetical protein
MAMGLAEGLLLSLQGRAAELGPDILETAQGLPADVGMERQAALQSLGLSLRQAGIPEKAIHSILLKTAEITAAETFDRQVERLKAAAHQLLTDRDRIRKLEEQMRQSLERKEFQRTLVNVNGASGIVAWETETHYVIVTNDHVLSEQNDPVPVSANTPGREEIGFAIPVVRLRDHRSKVGDVRDIAFLVLKKEDVRGGRLLPIRWEVNPSEGELATLVSGAHQTVSSGILVQIGNIMVLLGAKIQDGDSGSTYVIDATSGNSAVGVAGEAFDGNDIPFGPIPGLQIVREMAQAFRGTSSQFILAASDPLDVQAA